MLGWRKFLQLGDFKYGHEALKLITAFIKKHVFFRVSLSVFLTRVVIFVPTFSAILAIFLFRYIRITDVIVLITMYLLTMLGITAGYHRLFTHKSYEAIKPFSALLHILGSMTGQGPLLFWVAIHRKHHQSSDRKGDPHSPITHKSFFYAHIKWMMDFDFNQKYLITLVPDLIRDKVIFTVDRFYLLWLSIGIILPGFFAFLLTWSWVAFFTGCFWGGLIRMFLVHHVTWSVNSVCHFFGKQDFKTKDNSRNHILPAVLALGEGWHNNHHAFPNSAKHGLLPWQIDITYYIIKVTHFFKLTKNIRLPIHNKIKEKRLKND